MGWPEFPPGVEASATHCVQLQRDASRIRECQPEKLHLARLRLGILGPRPPEMVRSVRGPTLPLLVWVPLRANLAELLILKVGQEPGSDAPRVKRLKPRGASRGIP